MGSRDALTEDPVPDEIDFENLSFEAGKYFTPSVPVAERSLFAGRIDKIAAMIDAVTQEGQHVVLYGERGVGKTSLANILQKIIGGQGLVAQRVNCTSSDSYSALWHRMFSRISKSWNERVAGFREKERPVTATLDADLPETITPEIVETTLRRLASVFKVVVIFDEFDTLKVTATRRAMVETIKLLSDFAIPATIVLVGVADSVADILKEHASVERALVQVKMPRMSESELQQILSKGAAALGMSFSTNATNRITELSKGLPHYTHLMGLHAVRAALADKEMTVESDHIDQAIESALEKSQQTTIEAYNTATFSVRKHHLYKEVLLACALAEADELGWFTAASVRDPLNRIIPGRSYDVPAYVRHLTDFTSNDRGNVLEKSGVSHKFRFRFTNPLMQPFIILRGYAEAKIKSAASRATAER